MYTHNIVRGTPTCSTVTITPIEERFDKKTQDGNGVGYVPPRQIFLERFTPPPPPPPPQD